MKRENRGKMLYALCVCCCMLMASACKHKEMVLEGSATQEVMYSPSILIVFVDSAIGKEPLRTALEKYGCTIVYDYSELSGMAIEKPPYRTIEQTMRYLRRVKGVVSVERDRMVHLD